jgi:hypothetical protein
MGHSYAHEPGPETVLAAPAGGQAEAAFDVTNESGDIATYHLEVDRLPGPGWASGVGRDFEQRVAPDAWETLRLTLTPPVDAALDDYPFGVRVVSSSVGEIRSVSLTLRVTPRVEATPAPDVVPEAALSPAIEPEVALTPDPATPDADTPPTRAPEPTSAPAAGSQQTARPREGEHATADAAHTTAPGLASAPGSDAVQTADPGGSQPTPPAPSAPPSIPKPDVVRGRPPVVEAPRAGPAAPPSGVSSGRAQAASSGASVPQEQKPLIAAPPSPTTARAAAPTTVAPPSPPPVSPPPPTLYPEEAVTIVDVLPLDSSIDQNGDQRELTPTENSVDDPKEGAVLSLRPGETLLVRFPFTNAAQREQTYIVNEDGSLETGWIEIVQDSVYLTPNGQGMVSLRLKPPLSAAPGNYSFTVTVGPLGGILTPRHLTLAVLATPAVRLTAQEPTVSVGPWASAVEFSLAVESAGNADTAFRVSVKAPEAETDGKEAASGPGDLYETPQWRYLFDKELEDLRSPSPRRTPPAEPIRLRVCRRGWWLWGRRDSHTFRVAAIPVTDPTNGGKPGNIVELTAIRKRVLPFPALGLIPLFFLGVMMLSLLSPGAERLWVTNSPHYGNLYYVLLQEQATSSEPKPTVIMPARVRWDAPWFAWLRLERTDLPDRNEHGGIDDPVEVKKDAYEQVLTYTVRPLVVQQKNSPSINVLFVPVRTDDKLSLHGGSATTGLQAARKLNQDPKKVTVYESFVELPCLIHKTARLVMENTTDPGKNLLILVWLLKKDPRIEVIGINVGDKIGLQISGKARKPIQIIYTAGQPPAPNEKPELLFVTTDARHHLLHVKLNVTQRSR